MANPNPFAVSEEQAQIVEHVVASLSYCHDELLIRQFVDLDVTYLDEIAENLRMRTSMNNPDGLVTNYVVDPYVGNIGSETGGRVYEGIFRGVSVRTNVRGGRGIIIQTLARGLLGESYQNMGFTVTAESAEVSIPTGEVLPYNISDNYLKIDGVSGLFEISSRDSAVAITLSSAWAGVTATGLGSICRKFPTPCSIGSGDDMTVTLDDATVTLSDGIFPFDKSLSNDRYALRIIGDNTWYAIDSRTSNTELELKIVYAGATTSSAHYVIYDLSPSPELVQTDDRLMFPHAAIWEAEKDQREVRYRGFEPEFVEDYKDLIALTGGVIDVRSVRMQDGSYNLHVLTDVNVWVTIDNTYPVEHTRIGEPESSKHIRDYLHATKSSADIVYDNPIQNWTTSTDYVIGDTVLSSAINYICIIGHESGTFATDLSAGKWARVAFTKTTMKDNVDGSGQVRQEMTEVVTVTEIGDLPDPFITRENEIVNPFSDPDGGTGDRDGIIFKYKNLSADSETVCMAFTDSAMATLGNSRVAGIDFVKKKWEKLDDGTAVFWVLLTLYTRRTFWAEPPTADPVFEGTPIAPDFYEVVNVGTEYETHIRRWFGMRTEDDAEAFTYLTDQENRPENYVLGELRIHDTQKHAKDYTQTAIKQANPSALETAGVTTENRYKVLNVLGLEVGLFDIVTIIYDNLLQSQLGSTPTDASATIDTYAIAEVIPTLQSNGRWRKLYIQYKVVWSNIQTVAADAEADPPVIEHKDALTWRSRSIVNEGGYGEDTQEWASGVPVVSAEEIVKNKSGDLILSAGFAEHQSGEAHVEYVHRTGTSLEIETAIYESVGNSPALKKYTFYGVSPANIAAKYEEAKTYSGGGGDYSHKHVDMSVAPNGFATIVASAHNLVSGGGSDLYINKLGVTKKFIEKVRDEINAGFKYRVITITYDIKYWLSEKKAYDEINANYSYLMSPSVTQVARGASPRWRSVSIVSISSPNATNNSPINLPLPV